MYEIEDGIVIMEVIKGGVTAPQGFRAAGIHCGIRRNADKYDLALILADCECAAAAVYTTNLVQSAPLKITKRHLKDGRARAILANSGNANACAPEGEENVLISCIKLSQVLDLNPWDIIVNSTGVIGQRLPVERIEEAIPALVKALNADEQGSDAAARAIMTTDLAKKEIAVKLEIGGKTVKIGAICKGSGMIRPNMATMLAFITTDCAISSDLLHNALCDATRVSFNRVSVDGDTSTNDMAAILASGLAGNILICEKNEDYQVFSDALKALCVDLARQMARDGEGASRLVTCRVRNAESEAAAERLSMSVTDSNLVKAMMFGADANCGRVLCAMGYSGAAFDPEKVDVAFESAAGRVEMCLDGRVLEFDEKVAKTVLSESEVLIDIDIKDELGKFTVETYGCDLSYEYVRINGDYRS
ncbi:arginine biosynthesis bifunctional protein ArgJ [Clostridia bacterium]|nr:arginine biosynthesis bifunctional protein ArgJ [Clostridia bacterium]